MSRPASRRQHKKFCDAEGWSEVRSARGGAVRHHISYELRLDDGQILRTRISRPANNDRYGPSLWDAILRDQLHVSETDFWQWVDRGVQPPRPRGVPAAPPQALPAGLAHALIYTLGLSEQVVATMSRDEAIALMSEHWATPPE